MRIPSLIWRRAAACVLALGLAGSLALAAPAAAQDDRFPAPGKDLAKLLCEVFGGIFHDYGEPSLFVCQFTTGDIVCDGKECWIVLPLATPPLKEECDWAGGKYQELDRAAFACEVKEGVLMFTCVDEKQRECQVGWMAAKDPD